MMKNKEAAMRDYYDFPYDPDTGAVPCGERPECAECCWLKSWRRLTAEQKARSTT